MMKFSIVVTERLQVTQREAFSHIIDSIAYYKTTTSHISGVCLRSKPERKKKKKKKFTLSGEKSEIGPTAKKIKIKIKMCYVPTFHFQHDEKHSDNPKRRKEQKEKSTSECAPSGFGSKE